VKLKIAQLRRLGIANAHLYIAALLFLVGGLSKALLMLDSLFNYLMIAGVLSITIALCFLVYHSLKAVYIRNKHLKMK
jgi:hypothetical protein